jgi:hypothetical protein
MPNDYRFGQRHHTTIMCVDLDESDCVCNGRIECFLLARVLEAWLDIIEKGKAIVNLESGVSGDPWKLVSYSESSG